jgi:hypothetical protein
VGVELAAEALDDLAVGGVVAAAGGGEEVALLGSGGHAVHSNRAVDIR